MNRLETLAEEAVTAVLTEEYPPEIRAVKIRAICAELYLAGRAHGTSEAWQHYCEAYGSAGQSDEANTMRQIDQTIPIVLGDARIRKS